MEDVVTEYIGALGYKNLNKEIGCDDNGDRLSVDQLFEKNNILYFVEQKIRDDHDSTKKRGQYDNFEKKIMLLRKKYADKHIEAIMWFIDDGLIKNKKYYQERMDSSNYDNVGLYLLYSAPFFEMLDNGKNAWNEIVMFLKRLREENSDNVFEIPDFGSSEEIYNALLKLPKKYWQKLMSDEENYKLIRLEMFSKGDNYIKAKKQLGY